MSFDYGKLLDQAIGAAESISVARVERDTARYNSEPVRQRAALHNSEAVSAPESYASGNARNPAQGESYFDQIPKPLLYGSLGLLGVALVLKAL